MLPGRVTVRLVRTALVVAALSQTASPAAAQTIVGRVVDAETETSVGGAVVTLVDREGTERVRTLADSVGRFILAPPEAGEFYLAAERLGYHPTRSPLLALDTAGRASLELVMEPQPLGLEGFEVSVEAEAHELLREFGLEAGDLGNRWINRRAIEKVVNPVDIGRVLQWQNIPGVNIHIPGEASLSSSGQLCVMFQRGRTGSGFDTCALVVLNGVPAASSMVMMLDPETIEAMAVLLPTEATLYYGQAGGTGALLVWTRR